MQELKWTDAEKKVARKVFDAALDAELAEILAEFKSRAAKATEPEEMWSVEEYLNARRKHIDTKYDYRYSQLILLFGNLLREGRISEADLRGLSPEKIDRIRRFAFM